MKPYDFERAVGICTAVAWSEMGHSRPGRDSSQPGHVRYAAESGSELSCRDATGTNRMAETANIDRPPAARAAVSRPRSAKTTTVSASALAHHFDCSRTYIVKLEAEGVIQRQGDGFPLDRSRVAYLRHLRRDCHRCLRSARRLATCRPDAALRSERTSRSHPVKRPLKTNNWHTITNAAGSGLLRNQPRAGTACDCFPDGRNLCRLHRTPSILLQSS